MDKNIGFISTRFSGTDGVSMEASKWGEILESEGYNCFWFAGVLDKDIKKSFLVKEIFFNHDKNKWINEQVFGTRKRDINVTKKIHELRSFIKKKLYEFVKKFNVDILVIQNALSIPMNVPLGLALSEFIAETQIPTIAHHHDFYWERIRFSVNSISDYLHMSFPPKLSNMYHVTINTPAQEELALRTGISSIVIPNVLDFNNPPDVDYHNIDNIRKSIGIMPEDLMFLQPTRIVQRKGIEHSIGLIRELNDKKYKLVISHEAGDEGTEYRDWLCDYAKDMNVDLRFVSTKITESMRVNGNCLDKLSLWDIYPCADFITYPSLYEGFGNAFLEAIYFKKPILVNRYSIFVQDIEPQGFDLISMDGYITKKEVEKVKNILDDKDIRDNVVDHNYKIAKSLYSYEILKKHLGFLMANILGL